MAGAAGIFAPAFAASRGITESDLNNTAASHVIWEQVTSSTDDSIYITNPGTGNGINYFKYTYTKPADYLQVSDRINDTLDSESVTNKLFQDVSSTSNGGAIYNSEDKANVDIVADFINNSSPNGGAIYNAGSIGNITGNFINNSVGSGYGGAIYNTGSIENITGTFISNSSTRGGAIYNTGTIGSISGLFINNRLPNSSNNYGAAIYTTTDLNIVATNGEKTQFIQNGSQGVYGSQIADIYVASDTATVTLNATNNGEILMTSGMSGSWFNLKLTGDETGTIKLHDYYSGNHKVSIGAKATTEGNVTIDMADGRGSQYIFNSFTSDPNTKYKFDIDLSYADYSSEYVADRIYVPSYTYSKDGIIGGGSSGVITIDQFDFSNITTKNLNKNYKIQLLTLYSGNLQLALSDYLKSQQGNDEYKIGESHNYFYDDIKATTNWDDVYFKYDEKSDVYGTLGLDTTKTTNDSVNVTVTRTETLDTTPVSIMGDTLALWTDLQTDEVKNFNFGSADDVYTLQDYLIEQNDQQLNINGVAEGDKRSTIDFDRYEGFSLRNGSKFGAKNVEFKNARNSAIYSQKSSVDLSNVKFSNNYNYSGGGAISANHNANIDYEKLDLNNTNVNYNTNVNSSVFVNNTSKNGSGGAIGLGYRFYIYAGSQQPQSIDNSNNVSITDWVQKTIALNINDSLFDSNFAMRGGAVAVIGNIYDETSGWGGGPENLDAASQAASANAGVLNIKNSKFINNIAAYSEPEYNSARSMSLRNQALGGAIFNNAKTNIEGSLFDSNRVVNGNGGAIYLAPTQQNNYSGGDQSLSVAAMSLDNDSLISSQNTDGYIVFENGSTPDSSDVLTIKNTSFINNSVENTFEPITPEQYMNYILNYGDDETFEQTMAQLNSLFEKEAEKLGYTDLNDVPQDVGEQIANNVISEYQGYKDFQNLFAANGGAIYSGVNTKVSADGADVLFNNNRVINNGNEALNDIYMVTATGNSNNYSPAGSLDGEVPLDLVTLTLDARNGGTIILNGTIDGAVYKVGNEYGGGGGQPAALSEESGIQTYEVTGGGDESGTPELSKPEAAYNLNITGDGTGKVVFGNSVKNASIMTYDGSMAVLAKDSNWDNNILALNGGTISMVNNSVGTANLNRMIVVKDTNFVADVDLANKQMDRFTANEYGEHFGNLNVSGMNLLSDATDSKTEIYFAQEGLKGHVTSTVTEVAYTPIYKYNVRYENRDDAGYFVFDRTGSAGGNSSDAFNPSVLTAPVSSVAAAQATINETFKYVFEHADAFTQLPRIERMAQINANKYALRDSHDGVSTDYNHNLGSLCYDHNNKAAWFRPYATFETMNLKNGPKVNATTYGSLAGFDTDFHEHKHGWHSVGTGYIGYNGSQLSYKGVDTTMNGGILGYTHTMYKGNFWTALTLSAGASVGESRTMYGKEDFTSLMAGVGSKTGYNFEFKEGKYILQPIMFMSYTFVNTFDYTNAAGVRINADPAHSIQLNPSIRFISNFKNGWQPYASVGMVWNVMNENNVTANNVRLPEMSMKPYVEYGVGVQRNWKDKFTAFGQAMLRNGGRNGIALTAGFRWALGKDTPHNHDKVQTPKTDRTVLKQLTPQQKMALTGKKNTTITSAKAVLKQL